ncbi:unnamed protein product [marine sediment metagenome]|uniref:Uncharacterized protein n=1 Tax=marine sediment metagenome TaxID=412755 RepID=X0UMS9_9ZZZZ
MAEKISVADSEDKPNPPATGIRMDTPDLEVVPFFTSEKIISPVVTFIALTVTVTEADDFF